MKLKALPAVPVFSLPWKNPDKRHLKNSDMYQGVGNDSKIGAFLNGNIEHNEFLTAAQIQVIFHSQGDMKMASFQSHLVLPGGSGVENG